MFRRAFVSVMGFTQTTRTSTGMEALWCRLREADTDDTLVLTPLTWDADAEACAALINRHCEPDAEIYVSVYSWGCGQFFPRFCKALDERGRRVRHAIICDGVYRTPFLPTWAPANPWSMTKFPKIGVRGNVDEVTWFYQRRNRPWGHEPVADGRRTKINPGRQLDLKHEQMDDAAEFHDAVLRIAGVM